MLSVRYLFEVMPNIGFIIKAGSRMAKIKSEEDDNNNIKKQIIKKAIKKTTEKIAEEK